MISLFFSKKFFIVVTPIILIATTASIVSAQTNYGLQPKVVSQSLSSYADRLQKIIADLEKERQELQKNTYIQDATDLARRFFLGFFQSEPVPAKPAKTVLDDTIDLAKQAYFFTKQAAQLSRGPLNDKEISSAEDLLDLAITLIGDKGILSEKDLTNPSVKKAIGRKGQEDFYILILNLSTEMKVFKDDLYKNLIEQYAQEKALLAEQSAKEKESVINVQKTKELEEKKDYETKNLIKEARKVLEELKNTDKVDKIEISLPVIVNDSPAPKPEKEKPQPQIELVYVFRGDKNQLEESLKSSTEAIKAVNDLVQKNIVTIKKFAMPDCSGRFSYLGEKFPCPPQGVGYFILVVDGKLYISKSQKTIDVLKELGLLKLDDQLRPTPIPSPTPKSKSKASQPEKKSQTSIDTKKLTASKPCLPVSVIKSDAFNIKVNGAENYPQLANSASAILASRANKICDLIGCQKFSSYDTPVVANIYSDKDFPRFGTTSAYTKLPTKKGEPIEVFVNGDSISKEVGKKDLEHELTHVASYLISFDGVKANYSLPVGLEEALGKLSEGPEIFSTTASALITLSLRMGMIPVSELFSNNPTISDKQVGLIYPEGTSFFLFLMLEPKAIEKFRSYVNAGWKEGFTSDSLEKIYGKNVVERWKEFINKNYSNKSYLTDNNYMNLFNKMPKEAREFDRF